jgi:hypothetical protein
MALFTTRLVVDMDKPDVGSSVVAIGSVVVSLAIGGAAGYFIAKKHMESIIDEEVEAFKRDYAARQEANLSAMVTAQENAEAKGSVEQLTAVAISEQQGYISKDEALQRSVFDNAKAVPEWDEEAEEAFRLENAVFLITQDEWMLNETDFQQEQLTYYEGDDTLATATDTVVTEVVDMVGVDCLTKFGYGSRSPDTVYVRNENFNTDYEIVRATGRYSDVVLGLDDGDELEHSSTPRKFRAYHDN